MMQNLSVPKEQSWLSWFFRGLLLLGVFIMLARLAELQVIKGAYYRELSEGNRVRRVAIVAPRGKILDKDGMVLVDNIAVKRTVKFDPMEGYTKIPAEKTTPEDEIVTEWLRKYVYGSEFAHISGYLGESNAEEVDKIDPNCVEKGPRRLGSYVGRGGLEEYYECMLRGVDGEELVEVDTVGRRVRTLGRKQSEAGTDIKTTIDYKLQKRIVEAMEKLPGAVVVSTPSGALRALYSAPSFDPNIFLKTNEAQGEKIVGLFTDPALPMFNRAIGGIYHPGSIYKIVTTTAAIEEGKIDADYRYEDRGLIAIDEFQFKNWYFTQYGGTEGSIDVTRALARSTDTFFYEIGAQIGPEKLSEWSRRFGLADKTNLDLPGEVSGLVPSPEWKKAVKGERWFLGNTYHMAIGQGDLAVTPVENHRLAMFVANGGKICDLKLAGIAACTPLSVGNLSFELLKAGMKGACDPGGTGAPFFDFEPDVGCKTGTAETGVEDETHAWFTVFAPLDNPEVVVTVLVEKGGEGSKVAAPIARKILDFIYHP